jgi:hypothetical protein
MSSLPQVAEALQQVLGDVPTALARVSGFCQRRSKLSAATFVQTVVLGFLAHPTGSLHQLTQRAAECGVAISPQGLAHRFTPVAAALLRHVLDAALTQVIVADPVATGVLAKFPAVILLDSTTVALPDALADVWVGCGGRVEQGGRSALKLSVSLDVVNGQLAVQPSDGRLQDKSSPVQHASMPLGALRITDLGYWSLAVLGQIAADDAYFLSRLHLQTVVFAADGTRLDLVAWLEGLKRRRLSVPVTLGVTARLPGRLIAVRVPKRLGEARRDAIRADAKREGQTPNARTVALADWTLLVTNAPPDVLAIREALVLARARWQIELLFKLWKNEGHLDEWRSADPDRILCEVYAKLTALVIQHWILLTGCWCFADRSLTRAAQTVRDHAVGLLLALPSRRRLVASLRAIGRGFASGCRISARRRHPSLFQLLADPSSGRLA